MTINAFMAGSQKCFIHSSDDGIIYLPSISQNRFVTGESRLFYHLPGFFSQQINLRLYFNGSQIFVPTGKVIKNCNNRKNKNPSFSAGGKKIVLGPAPKLCIIKGTHKP